MNAHDVIVGALNAEGVRAGSDVHTWDAYAAAVLVALREEWGARCYGEFTVFPSEDLARSHVARWESHTPGVFRRYLTDWEEA